MEKYCRVGQATDNNMAHAHCMLDTEGYRHPQNMEYLLLFHRNNIDMKAPQSYVIRTLRVLHLI